MAVIAQICFSPDIRWYLVYLAAGVCGVIGFFTDLRNLINARSKERYLNWSRHSAAGTTRRRPGMPVDLRDERSGSDVRHLFAWCDEAGNLHIDGRDMGPGTAPVSDDGEYEWFQQIAAADVPRVRELLDAPEDANILDVLTNWTDARSYELERLLRESSIPIKRHIM